SVGESLVAIALLPFTLAARQPDGGVVHAPIVRRSHSNRVANLPKAVEALRRKYGYQVTNVKSTNSKRASTAAIPITDEENDSSYSGVVSIGTPTLILSSIYPGSSDLWVATTSCTSCGSDIPEFNLSKLSTCKATSSHLETDYGSGSAQGNIVAQDSVTFGSFEMSQPLRMSILVTWVDLI
ncbi:hypothetical protein F4604DRAFT_1730893, partial [Suillus subluteus]